MCSVALHRDNGLHWRVNTKSPGKNFQLTFSGMNTPFSIRPPSGTERGRLDGAAGCSLSASFITISSTGRSQISWKDGTPSVQSMPLVSSARSFCCHTVFFASSQKRYVKVMLVVSSIGQLRTLRPPGRFLLTCARENEIGDLDIGLSVCHGPTVLFFVVYNLAQKIST